MIDKARGQEGKNVTIETIRYELGGAKGPYWKEAYPVVAIGNFDGVHVGHQEIFRRVREEAARNNGKSVVLTFEPHPLKLLVPERCPQLITPYSKRLRLIEHFGMDAVAVIHFTREFASLSPEAFFRDILTRVFNVKAVFIGYDFSFGRDRTGSVENLKRLGKEHGIKVEVVAPFKAGDTPVSSTKIRQLVAEGKVETARELLGRYFFLSGEVVKGHNRGKSLGFPTANIETGHELFPARGVYATFLYYRGKRYRAATNIGVNPTFTNGALSIETYVVNFDEILYGCEVSISFVRKIRDEICFPSAGMLVKRMEEDIRIANEILEKEERETPQATPEG